MQNRLPLKWQNRSRHSLVCYPSPFFRLLQLDLRRERHIMTMRREITMHDSPLIKQIEQPVECPLCQRTGTEPSEHVMFEGSKHTTQCRLCWGVGILPPLIVVVENFARLAAYYWTCTCEMKVDGLTYERLHPINHDHCPKCGMMSEFGKRPLVGYVQACYQHFYNLDLDIIQPELTST